MKHINLSMSVVVRTHSLNYDWHETQARPGFQFNDMIKGLLQHTESDSYADSDAGIEIHYNTKDIW